jgi:hypothetical protein
LAVELVNGINTGASLLFRPGKENIKEDKNGGNETSLELAASLSSLIILLYLYHCPAQGYGRARRQVD